MDTDVSRAYPLRAYTSDQVLPQSLEQLYNHCIAHDQNNTAPTEKEVMKRLLAHMNGITSVGEVLVDSKHVSAECIAFLREALDSVHDALEDDSSKLSASTATPNEKAGAQRKKRKIVEKDAMFPESTSPPTSPTSNNEDQQAAKELHERACH